MSTLSAVVTIRGETSRLGGVNDAVDDMVLRVDRSQPPLPHQPDDHRKLADEAEILDRDEDLRVGKGFIDDVEHAHDHRNAAHRHQAFVRHSELLGERVERRRAAAGKDEDFGCGGHVLDPIIGGGGGRARRSQLLQQRLAAIDLAQHFLHRARRDHDRSVDARIEAVGAADRVDVAVEGGADHRSVPRNYRRARIAADNVVVGGEIEHRLFVDAPFGRPDLGGSS
jgi:hypothetical protein